MSAALHAKSLMMRLSILTDEMVLESKSILLDLHHQYIPLRPRSSIDTIYFQIRGKKVYDGIHQKEVLITYGAAHHGSAFRSRVKNHGPGQQRNVTKPLACVMATQDLHPHRLAMSRMRSMFSRAKSVGEVKGNMLLRPLFPAESKRGLQNMDRL